MSKSVKAIKLIKKHPEVQGLYYIVVRELPEDQRKEFTEWLYEQTMPVVELEDARYGKPTDCAYSWDYEMWYDSWIEGEEPPKHQTDTDTINL